MSTGYGKKGFTLVEILVSIAIGAGILLAMFGVTIAYLRIWKETTGPDMNAKFTSEVVSRNILKNEMSIAVRKINNLVANNSKTVDFRKLDGSPVAQGDSDGFFYWQAQEPLPFINDIPCGVVEYWLRYTPSDIDNGKLSQKAGTLAIIYRCWKPSKTVKVDNTQSNNNDHFEQKLEILLENCKGINFGYYNSAEGKIEYFKAPKLVTIDGVDQYLVPEMLQILLND